MLPYKNQPRLAAIAILNGLIMGTKSGSVRWDKQDCEEESYIFRSFDSEDRPRYVVLDVTDTSLWVTGRFEDTCAFTYTITRSEHSDSGTDPLVLIAETIINSVRRCCSCEATTK